MITIEVLEKLLKKRRIYSLCWGISEIIYGDYVDSITMVSEEFALILDEIYKPVSTELYKLRDKIDMHYESTSGFWWDIEDTKSRKEFIRKAIKLLKE